MNELQILSIDLKVPQQNFEQEMQECIDVYLDDTGIQMTASATQMRTKHGKNMFKIIIENSNSDNFTILAEQDDTTGDVTFSPFKFSNFNNGFYSGKCSPSVLGQNEDPAVCWNTLAKAFCYKHKGTYASILNSETTLIKDGVTQRQASQAIIDDDGNVYCARKTRSISGEEEDVDFTVRKPIAEWLSENREVGVAIAKLSLIDKMNYIGKHLVAARLNDEIDSDEFVDIFRQAGIIGFSDASILNIYKLLM